ncbi:MAG: hypothetical protein DRJ03_17030 [Chloroflexi bacterium]|nr:MAG: hypothetical protein DRJ03_17030 [Chloroflexota bacterium]
MVTVVEDARFEQEPIAVEILSRLDEVLREISFSVRMREPMPFEIMHWCYQQLKALADKILSVNIIPLDIEKAMDALERSNLKDAQKFLEKAKADLISIFQRRGWI